MEIVKIRTVFQVIANEAQAYTSKRKKAKNRYSKIILALFLVGLISGIPSKVIWAAEAGHRTLASYSALETVQALIDFISGNPLTVSLQVVPDESQIKPEITINESKTGSDIATVVVKVSSRSAQDPFLLAELVMSLSQVTEKIRFRNGLVQIGYLKKWKPKTNVFEDVVPRNLEPYDWLETQINARQGSKLAKLRLELAELANQRAVLQLELIEGWIGFDSVKGLNDLKKLRSTRISAIEKMEQDLLESYANEWNRKTASNAQFKATFDKVIDSNPNFHELVAANNRQGVRDIVEKSLPWHLMEPIETRYWKYWLDGLVKSSGKKSLVYRGFGSGSPWISKSGQAYFFSPAITSEKRLTWNNRLRFLSEKRSRIAPPLRRNEAAPPETVKVANLLVAHAAGTGGQSLGDMISTSTDIKVAWEYGLRDQITKVGAFLVDQARIFPNTLGEYSYEKEVLIPLVLFPDEVLYYQEAPRESPRNNIEAFLSEVNKRLKQAVGPAATHKSFTLNFKKWGMEQIRRAYGLSQIKFKSTKVSLTSNGPFGQLMPSQRRGGGSTGGRWYVDEKGVEWFLKRDYIHPELQTSAEVISAAIYRTLGYNTPETHITYLNGVRYSAAKLLSGNLKLDTYLSGYNTPEFRQMRIVAAYLADWDRMQVGPNNFAIDANNFAIFDFGGTLGARAQGEYKPGTIVSKTIGAFADTTDIKSIYDSFRIDHLPLEHPWNQITQEDIIAIIDKFKKLTNIEIENIVKQAQYSNKADELAMIRILENRRDGIIQNLAAHLLPSISSPLPRSCRALF